MLLMWASQNMQELILHACLASNYQTCLIEPYLQFKDKELKDKTMQLELKVLNINLAIGNGKNYLKMLYRLCEER